ncbi:hypothetical protein M3661_29900, partial [Paenibacillus sp. MER 180]|nr:hypothetical protein [Paenibacillus sp. MER 180]
AGAVLDRVTDLRIARHGNDVECDATFVDGPSTCGAHGRDARVALLRAFVRARFGDEVDAPPPFPHRIEHGAGVRYDPGVPIPTTDDEAATGAVRIFGRYRACSARVGPMVALELPLLHCIHVITAASGGGINRTRAKRHLCRS